MCRRPGIIVTQYDHEQYRVGTIIVADAEWSRLFRPVTFPPDDYCFWMVEDPTQTIVRETMVWVPTILPGPKTVRFDSTMDVGSGRTPPCVEPVVPLGVVVSSYYRYE